MKHKKPNEVNRDIADTINLKWYKAGSVCPEQYYAYFYNSKEDRTYCIYLREDTFWWSADLYYASGEYTPDTFEKLPYEQTLVDYINLAFFYDTDTDNLAKVVEDVLIYLNHRFPYLKFDSKIRENYDFTAGMNNEDKDAYFELLERRVSLMKKYLEKYEAYKRTI